MVAAPIAANRLAATPSSMELRVRYTRVMYGARAPRVGSWWGPGAQQALPAKARFTEEVDSEGSSAAS